MYTFRQVLDIMNTGEVFTCQFITYSRKKKTGGLVRRLEAKIIQREAPAADRPDTPAEKKARRRSQNHRQHHTRNVALVVDGHPTEQVRRIRIPLLIRFNGQSVVP